MKGSKRVFRQRTRQDRRQEKITTKQKGIPVQEMITDYLRSAAIPYAPGPSKLLVVRFQPSNREVERTSFSGDTVVSETDY